MKNIGIGILFVGMLVACGRDREKPEEVTKLRAIGVSASPAIATPSVPVTLTIYALAPTQQTISASTFTDDSSVLTYTPTDLKTSSADPTYTDLGTIKLVAAQATFTAPAQAVLDKFGGEAVKLRYAIRLEANDGDDEKIVGDILMVGAGSAAASWQVPTVKITGLDTGVSGDKTDIGAEVTNPNNEDIKTGWYVSSGAIANRRSRSTKWSEYVSGAQSVVFTAHGKRSRTFAVGVKKVDITQ